MGSAIKNLPAIQETQETQVWSLDGEDPLEEGKATHSSILAWRIPGTEESGVLQSMGSHRVGYNWATKHTCTQFKVLYLTLTSPSHWGHHERREVHKYTVATITPGSTRLCYCTVITPSVVSGSLPPYATLLFFKWSCLDSWSLQFAINAHNTY